MFSLVTLDFHYDAAVSKLTCIVDDSEQGDWNKNFRTQICQKAWSQDSDQWTSSKHVQAADLYIIKTLAAMNICTVVKFTAVSLMKVKITN